MKTLTDFFTPCQNKTKNSPHRPLAMTTTIIKTEDESQENWNVKQAPVCEQYMPKALNSNSNIKNISEFRWKTESEAQAPTSRQEEQVYDPDLDLLRDDEFDEKFAFEFTREDFQENNKESADYMYFQDPKFITAAKHINQKSNASYSLGPREKSPKQNLLLDYSFLSKISPLKFSFD